jgi:hypothetical protein
MEIADFRDLKMEINPKLVKGLSGAELHVSDIIYN